MLKIPALEVALKVSVTERLYAWETVRYPMLSPRMEAILPDMLFLAAL